MLVRLRSLTCLVPGGAEKRGSGGRMADTYSARELARAAGYLIRSVPEGAVTERVYPFGRVLEIGPEASDLAIIRHARRHLATPICTRSPTKTAAIANRSAL